jgi:single-strand DNA-binding protein
MSSLATWQNRLRVDQQLLAVGRWRTLSSFTVSGLVATTPRHLVTQDGLPITSFRLASTEADRQVPPTDENSYTNWFTITAFRQLAINLAGSISKGERVIVTGELKVRDWDNGERAGTSVEIVAFTVGHDLRYGTAQFTRTVLQAEPVGNAVPVLGVDYVL